jgi:hypothetical protein
MKVSKKHKHIAIRDKRHGSQTNIDRSQIGVSPTITNGDGILPASYSFQDNFVTMAVKNGKKKLNRESSDEGFNQPKDMRDQYITLQDEHHQSNEFTIEH